MSRAHSNKIYKSDSSAAILASILNIRIFPIPTFWGPFVNDPEHFTSHESHLIKNAFNIPKVRSFFP